MGKAGFRGIRMAALLVSAVALSGLGACHPNRPAVVAYMQPPQIYCYQTLARADCYAQPVPGDYNRMVGFYGPRPAEMPPQLPVELTTTGPATNN